jgi:hypothetical protein
MSMDQIWFSLCDIDILKREVGGRVEKAEPVAVVGKLKPDKDGLYRGRAADGTPIKGTIGGGKSLARRLMEEEERKRKEKKGHGT